MYAPESPQPEWIEIYNKSSKSINLLNYQLADNKDTIKIVFKELIIEPLQFLVISADSSINNFFNITSHMVVENIPTLNNSGDKIILLDSLNRTIDSLEYSPVWGGTNGKSLERISFNDSSTNSINWNTSINPEGATPGYKNSVTPKYYDLKIAQFKNKNSYGISGEEQTFEITVKNSGELNSDIFTLDIFNDSNADSITNSDENIYSHIFPAITAGDSINVNFNYSDFQTGVNYFIAKVSTNLDEDSSNNVSFTNFVIVNINEERNDIVIN